MGNKQLVALSWGAGAGKMKVVMGEQSSGVTEGDVYNGWIFKLPYRPQLYLAGTRPNICNKCKGRGLQWVNVQTTVVFLAKCFAGGRYEVCNKVCIQVFTTLTSPA